MGWDFPGFYRAFFVCMYVCEKMRISVLGGRWVIIAPFKLATILPPPLFRVLLYKTSRGNRNPIGSRRGVAKNVVLHMKANLVGVTNVQIRVTALDGPWVTITSSKLATSYACMYVYVRMLQPSIRWLALVTSWSLAVDRSVNPFTASCSAYIWWLVLSMEEYRIANVKTFEVTMQYRPEIFTQLVLIAMVWHEQTFRIDIQHSTRMFIVQSVSIQYSIWTFTADVR